MLRYFRINDPYRLLALLAILVLIYLPLLINSPGLLQPELRSIVIGEKIDQGFSPYTEIIDSIGPFTAWFYGIAHFVFGDSLFSRHLFSFFIIFIQATFLGIIFIDKKVFPESSYIPSLIFGILFLFSFDTIALTGELVGSTFLLLVLNSLFKEIEFREQGNENVFNVGLFIGIASLFTFSFSIYLIAALIILSLYTRISGAKFLLTIVGFLMPHALLLSIYYIKDGVTEIWNYFYLPNLGFGGIRYTGPESLLLLGSLPLLFLIFSLVVFTRESRFTKYQSQIFQAMFFWALFGLLHLFYAKEVRPQSLITLVPALSFFISHALTMIRRKRLAEIAFWIFSVGTVSVSYLSRYDLLDRVNYDNLLVGEAQTHTLKQKRIVVLGENKDLYRENTLSTPFYNWDLSKEIFAEPEYYENITVVYHGFKNDPPDVIIDPGQKMKPFLERIPELQKKYASSPEGYRKISN